MDREIVQSRIGLGIVIVVLGSIGATVAALFGPKGASDDGRLAIGPPDTVLPPTSAPVHSACPSPDWDDFYYPMWVFAGPPAHDFMFRNAYTPALRALKEPSLSCGNAGADESYRFLFVPSFHGSIVVRVDRIESEIRLHTAMLSAPRGREIVASQDLKLQKKQWDDLLGRLAAARFWDSPPTDNGAGADGANWLIEGRLADRYWVVERYSPSRSEAFGSAGIRFLELAKMTSEAAPELYE